MRRGGRGQSRGRLGARGGGGRGGAQITPPSDAPPPLEGHVGDQPLEFVIRLYRISHGCLRLSTPFSRVMELEQLRAEVAYLKKLQALIREKQKTKQK